MANNVNYNKFFKPIDYYNKVVVPINPVKYKVKSDKMVVCPVHNDHDPSLGIISSDKGDLCHCFGCNFWGDVVQLHQEVSQKHFKRFMSEEEAVRDLCKIFNVNFDDVPKEGLSNIKDKGTRQEVALSEAIENFDIGDFQRLIYEGKVDKRPIGYFNAVVMTMVNSLKEV